MVGVSAHYTCRREKQPGQCFDDVVCRWACAEFVVLHWMLDLRVHGHDYGAKELLDI